MVDLFLFNGFNSTGFLIVNVCINVTNFITTSFTHLVHYNIIPHDTTVDYSCIICLLDKKHNIKSAELHLHPDEIHQILQQKVSKYIIL